MESAARNWLIAFLSLIVIVAGLGLYFQQKEEVSNKSQSAKPVTNGTAILSFSSENLSLSIGKTTILNIQIDSEDKVAAVELNLTYDPQIVTIIDIKPADFLTDSDVLLKTIDNKKGVSTLAFGSLKPLAGQGTIATITVRSKTKGETALDLTTSRVAVSGSSDDALKLGSKTTITVD